VKVCMLCILCNNWPLFVPRELMSNITLLHLYTASVEFPCPDKIDHFEHTNRDRKTELLNLSLQEFSQPRPFRVWSSNLSEVSNKMQNYFSQIGTFWILKRHVRTSAKWWLHYNNTSERSINIIQLDSKYCWEDNNARLNVNLTLFSIFYWFFFGL